MCNATFLKKNSAFIAKVLKIRKTGSVRRDFENPGSKEGGSGLGNPARRGREGWGKAGLQIRAERGIKASCLSSEGTEFFWNNTVLAITIRNTHMHPKGYLRFLFLLWPSLFVHFNTIFYVQIRTSLYYLLSVPE